MFFRAFFIELRAVGHSLFIILSGLALGLTWAGSSLAEIVGPIEIPRHDALIHWHDIGIPADVQGIQVIEGPTHGVLVVDDLERVIQFHPGLDFWSFEHDRFEIEFIGVGISATKTILMVATEYQPILISSFEGNDPLPAVGGESIEISSAGALVGSLGVYREVAPSSPASFGRFDWQILGLESPNGEPTGNGSSGEIHVTIDDPPTNGGSQGPPDMGFWSLFGTYDLGYDPIAEVRVGYEEDTILLQGRFDGNGAGNYQVTDPWAASLPPGPHRVRFENWSDVKSGFRLWIDDRAVIDMTALYGSGNQAAGMALGQVEGSPHFEQTLKIDHLRTFTGDLQPSWDLLLSDDFEADLSAWDEVVEGAGSVETTRDSEALRLTLDGAGWGAYVKNSAPTAATEISVRFLFDTSGLTMASTDQLHLLIGYPQDAVGNNHLQVRLGRLGDAFKIRLDAKDDAGVLHATPWQPLSRGEHLVELRWRAATAAEVADGYARLFIDGDFAGDALGIENAGRIIETLRFGALNVKVDTHGILELDEYVAWQRAPSGP